MLYCNRAEIEGAVKHKIKEDTSNFPFMRNTGVGIKSYECWTYTARQKGIFKAEHAQCLYIGRKVRYTNPMFSELASCRYQSNNLLRGLVVYGSDGMYMTILK